MGPDSDDRPVSVLVVCTGNVCRSPFAAALLADRLSSSRPGRFEVSSAGTHALVDADMDPGSRDELTARGVPWEEFRGRQVSPELLGGADLVVAMTAEHRRFLVAAVPPAAERVVLLDQLARGLARARRRGADPAAARGAEGTDLRTRWREVPRVVERFGRVPWSWQVRDVPDPYRRGPEAFAGMARTVEAAVDEVVRWDAASPR